MPANVEFGLATGEVEQGEVEVETSTGTAAQVARGDIEGRRQITVEELSPVLVVGDTEIGEEAHHDVSPGGKTVGGMDAEFAS